jgi:hypothetical protein
MSKRLCVRCIRRAAPHPKGIESVSLGLRGTHHPGKSTHDALTLKESIADGKSMNPRKRRPNEKFENPFTHTR